MKDERVKEELRSILNSRKVSKKAVHEVVSAIYDDVKLSRSKKEMVELIVSSLSPKKKKEDRTYDHATTCYLDNTKCNGCYKGDQAKFMSGNNMFSIFCPDDYSYRL